MNLKNLTVKAGQTITIEPRFIAEPEPSSTWSFDSVEVKPDERVSMGLEIKSAKLVILNAKRSDTGKYTIKLMNSVGSDSASCDVIVLCAPAKPNGPIEVKDIKKYEFLLILCLHHAF